MKEEGFCCEHTVCSVLKCSVALYSQDHLRNVSKEALKAWTEEDYLRLKGITWESRIVLGSITGSRGITIYWCPG